MSIVRPPDGITRVRRSLLEISKPDDDSKPDIFQRERENFLKAWTLIQDPAKHDPVTDEDSFYQVATYHGMPYDKPNVPPIEIGNDDLGIWPSYCQHANVLFPVWHRYYTTRLENALNNALKKEKCENYDEQKDQVALHYWDQTYYVEGTDDPLNPSDDTKQKRVPRILTDDFVTIDEKPVPNPLKQYKLPLRVKGYKDDNIYNKEKDYITHRFPFSGITNPANMHEAAQEHNAQFTQAEALGALKDNINDFLDHGRINPPDKPRSEATFSLYKNCLDIPRDNYNWFSNTSTGTQYAQYSVEQPHNDIHVAVGGFTKYVIDPETGEVKPIWTMGPEKYMGANGDMGANEVASFDPIFFLHHSNVDRMFWVWQKKQHATDDKDGFTINEDDADHGFTPEKGQGPSAYQTKDQKLTMDTPLHPFYSGKDSNIVTARGCINIESQLGFTYSIGSLDQEDWPSPKIQKQKVENIALSDQSSLNNLPSRLKGVYKRDTHKGEIYLAQYTPLFDRKDIKWPDDRFEPIFTSYSTGPHFEQSFVMTVEGIPKDSYHGSFAVHVGIKVDGKWITVAQKSVLTRWDRKSCSNCQKNPKATLFFEFNNKVLKNTLENMTRKDVKIHFIYRNKEGLMETSEFIEKDDGIKVNHFMKFVEIAA